MPRILRRDAEKILANVPEEHVFRCRDGATLVNVNRRGEALNTVTDETFTHHSNEKRKDFGNWVRDVLGDKKLARDLDRSPGQRHIDLDFAEKSKVPRVQSLAIGREQ